MGNAWEEKYLSAWKLLHADIRMWSRNMDMDLGKCVRTSRLMAAEIEFSCKGYRRESHEREGSNLKRIWR
jgi:hypothetical protein